MRKARRVARDDFAASVKKVVDNENCSGCGACALLSSRVKMELATDGYMRPAVAPGTSNPDERRLFQKVCPGVTVDSRGAKAPQSHPTFGSYWSVWEAWAADSNVRHAGSSGGVTTALVQMIIAAGGEAIGAAASQDRPNTTVPVKLTTKAEALAAAGSRYAPVATAALGRGLQTGDAFVGKPCEVAAMRALGAGDLDAPGPVLLTFFCAGTPSQFATDRLANDRLGVDTADIDSLRYRGSGWPGEFTVVAKDGRTSQLSYKESWGQVLGKALQWRCKICPDGTGQLADVSVGDYWESDSDGYPRFDADSIGRSVVICRTERGHDLLMRAVRGRTIQVEEFDISRLESVQPLQVDRRATMAGRIIGTAAARRAVPRFRGFGVFRLGLCNPNKNLRAGVGAFLRVHGRRA
jgi:coenzyme F420 hydrogenase subunit beta